MSAAEALNAARAAGIRVGIDGDDLVLEAPAPPLAAVLDALSRHKPGIIALLRPASDNWTAEDWQAFFDERAGIRQNDGGLTWADAERLALEDTIDRWLSCHPAEPTPAEAGCTHCGRRDRAGAVLLPFFARGDHIWVHDVCWRTWYQERKRVAREALLATGLRIVSTTTEANFEG
jgi:hypothetical protein